MAIYTILVYISYYLKVSLYEGKWEEDFLVLSPPFDGVIPVHHTLDLFILEGTSLC